MEDSVGKIFAIIASVLFMVFVPLTLILQSVDKNVQRYVDASVETFKDTCISSGCITEESYQKLISDLSSTGYTYEIKIEHYSKEFFSDTNVQGVHDAYMGNSTQTIVEKIATGMRDQNGTPMLIEGRPYEMENGDYIEITVTSVDSTLGTKIANLITLGALRATGINTIDHGRIKTTYNV